MSAAAKQLHLDALVPKLSVAYHRALVAFLPGENGVTQLVTVRRHLKPLERAGLISFADGAWFLTDTGRAAMRAAPTLKAPKCRHDFEDGDVCSKCDEARDS